MKKLALLFPAVCAILLLAADSAKIPPMPFAVTGNAVAVLKNGTELYSVMGVGIKKTWDDVSNRIYVLHFKSGKWVEGRAVPALQDGSPHPPSELADRFLSLVDTSSMEKGMNSPLEMRIRIYPKSAAGTGQPISRCPSTAR